MFSYVVPEHRVRQDHPLRPIRRMTDEVLATLSLRFDRMYSDMGRPSIPPEQLLRALLLQSLYTIRSERLLMEEIDYSILFRWFVGLGMDEEIWSPTTFSKNRDRLLEGDVAAAFFDAVVDQARHAGLLSDEHFTVDGTLLEAWASLKSFRPKEAGPTDPPDDPGNPRSTRHRASISTPACSSRPSPRAAPESAPPGPALVQTISRLHPFRRNAACAKASELLARSPAEYGAGRVMRSATTSGEVGHGPADLAVLTGPPESASAIVRVRPRFLSLFPRG
jgi:transposase